MTVGSARRSMSTIALSLGVAVSCGRSLRGESSDSDAGTAYGGRATSGGTGAEVAGSVGAAVAGDASGLAGASAGASGTSNGGSTEPGILLFDGAAVRVGVVGDREGNALVQWDPGGGQVFFARWNAAERVWHYPAPVPLDAGFVVDTYGSGHPILIGDQVDPQSGVRTTVVRRFELETNEWGPAQSTGIEGASTYPGRLSMDGAGNVYALWLDDARTGETWTWWPVDAAGWAPLRTLEQASGIVGARQAGAWLWQENSGFGVRAFDLGAGDWSDENELEPLSSGSASVIHYVVVGPSGEALAAALHHDQMDVAMSVWRYDPTLAVWQPKDTALELATNDDPNTLYGAAEPITDFLHQDVVAVLLPMGNQFDLQMNRRDPSTGIWSPLHEFVGLTNPNAFTLTADDSGDLYGCAPPSGLFHYNSVSGVWTDPAIDAGCDFVVSRTGAFALGLSADLELTAYRHPGGDGEWQRAQGLPAGVVPELGSVAFASAALSEGQAIVVWPTRDGAGGGSVRAAFIE